MRKDGECNAIPDHAESISCPFVASSPVDKTAIRAELMVKIYSHSSACYSGRKMMHESHLTPHEQEGGLRSFLEET